MNPTSRTEGAKNATMLVVGLEDEGASGGFVRDGRFSEW